MGQTMKSSLANAPEQRGMMTGLGAFVVRHPWAFLVSYVAVIVVSVVLGIRVVDALQTQGFDDPNSESLRVAEVLSRDFLVTEPDLVLIMETTRSRESLRRESQELLTRLSQTPGIADVVSPWSPMSPQGMVSSSGDTAVAFVTYAQNVEAGGVAQTVTDTFTGPHGTLTIHAIGDEVIDNAALETVYADLVRAEMVALPLTIVALVVVFGSVVAAGLPLVVAAGAVGGSLLVLSIATLLTDVSVFALNAVMGLGLALGIDYSLLIITRFREEIAAGRSTAEAVAIATGTAGRTVVVSGAAVAVTLGSLLVFPQYFLRSFAFAGISASLLSVLGAVVAIPALLAILGPRINRLAIRKSVHTVKSDGAWAKIAKLSMRHPWPIAVASMIALVVLAAPALSVQFGTQDERGLPADSPVVEASAVLVEQFPDLARARYDIVLQGPGDPAQVAAFAEQVSGLPGIKQVVSHVGVFASGRILAPPSDTGSWRTDSSVRMVAWSDRLPGDPAGRDLTLAIRDVPAPADDTLVGGADARTADSLSSVVDRGRIAVLWLVAASLVILFLFTGSVLIPIKAVMLNMLSLAAALGILVWIFQGGNLRWLTGEYTATGTIDMTTAAVIAVIVFALSMDYEVFMLGRITEEHEAAMNTTDAVARGLQHTGKVVTAAAVLIAIVFASFLAGGVTAMKQLGLGVTVAILIDATIIRALLVPAFMRLAGEANWWCPPMLKSIHGKVGMRHGDSHFRSGAIRQKVSNS